MKKLLLFCLAMFLFQSVLLSQDVEDTVMIFGRERFFRIHLPLNYNSQKKYPLVLVFHGGGGNAKNIEKVTGFSPKADKEDFIVVYPYGTGAFDKRLLTWNTWECCGYAHKKNINDVAFVKLMLEKIKSDYSINDKMIYATGLSNGGMMCYLLACEMSDQFAAVAPVAASMFDDSDCNPTNQLSMIIFNSIDDKHIPYEGGIGEEALVKVEKMSVEKVVDFWVHKFNCTFLNKTKSKFFQMVDFGNSKGTEIVFYTLLRGGHTWYGGEKAFFFAPKPANDLSATDLIWDFFKKHPKTE